MQIRIIYVLLFLATSHLYSQQIVTGTITDKESQKPVTGATIYFPDLEKGFSTDIDGNFQLINLPDGTHKTIISSIGYATLNIEVALPLLEELKITMLPSAIEMEEIIISTPFHQLQSENVMRVERASMANLSKKGAINLSEGISQIAGVENITTGVGIGKPVIRGLSSNRVLVYTQGIRLENQQYGEEHGLGISAKGIESIEVIKGPASLLYGSDAIGGVLYLNPEKFAPSNTLNTEINSEFYTNTHGYQVSGMAKNSWEKLKVLARLGYAAHSDYNMGNAQRVTNTRFNETDFKAGIGYQGSNFKSDLRYNFNSSNIGIPEEVSIQETDKKPLLPYQEIDNHVVSIDNSIFFPTSSLNIKLGYQFNKRLEFEEEHGEEHENEHEDEHEDEHELHEEDGHAGEHPALEMHLETFNYNLKYNFPKRSNFETIVGIQGMYQTNKNFGEEYLIPDAETIDFGIFTTSHLHFEKWDFQGGIRYDYRNLEGLTNENHTEFGSNINRSFNSINGALGAKFDFAENFTSRLNLASGFRAPNLAELTSDGAHHGANRYELGNPDLNYEQNFQIDLSLEWRNDHHEAFINAFHNSVSDYIFLNPTNKIVDGDVVYEYNQDNASLYGGEIGFHLHPHPLDWLHWDSSFEMVIGKLSGGEYLPLIPANSLTNTLRFELRDVKHLKGRYGFIRLKSVFEKNDISEFETETGAYNLVSAGLGATLKAGNSEFNIGISGNNLLDKTYFSHLSRLKADNIYNIGRNIQFSVSWNL